MIKYFFLHTIFSSVFLLLSAVLLILLFRLTSSSNVQHFTVMQKCWFKIKEVNIYDLVVQYILLKIGTSLILSK